MADRKPFHKSIEEILQSIGSGCGPHSMFELLRMLLDETAIPENHGAIIEAWQRYLASHHFHSDYDLASRLREHQKEVEAEAKTKQEARVKEAAADAYDDPY